MKRKATLTSGPVGRTLLFLTLPMIAGHFAIIAFNVADTYFVAKLGTRELAAMSFTFPVAMFIVSLTLGLGAGTGSVVSQAIGSGDSEGTRRLATDSLILALGIAAGVSAAGVATIRPVFRLIGAGPEILPLIEDYMTVWFIGAPLLVVPMVGNYAVRATGDVFFPSVVMIAGSCVNVVLDPLLIFGLGPFPRLELRGAAIATVFGRMVTMTVALLVLRFRHRLISFSRPRLGEMWRSWRRVVSIGAPAAATNALMPACMFVITRIVAGFGADAVAAVGTGGRILGFATLPLMSLSAVLIVFAGQNWGAQQVDRVAAGRTICFRFALVWGLVCVAVFAVAAKPIARLFSDDPAVLEKIALYLWIVPLGVGAGAIPRLAGMIFNGVNRPLHAVKINVLFMLGMLVPASWLGSVTFGFVGILIGNVAANILAGLTSHGALQAFLRKASAATSGPAQAAPAVAVMDTDTTL